jgi:hypothetical protein
MTAIWRSRQYCPRDTIRQAMVTIRTKGRNRKLLLVLTEGDCLQARFLFKDLRYLADYTPFFITVHARRLKANLA